MVFVRTLCFEEVWHLHTSLEGDLTHYVSPFLLFLLRKPKARALYFLLRFTYF